MCDDGFDSPYKIFFIFFDLTLILILCVMHFVFYFYIKETEFNNIFDTYESSPLFDFSIGGNCGANSHIIFYVWEGRKQKEVYYYKGKRRTKTTYVDRTEIDKINGHLFCYKKISYKDLLYNGQIIKNNENCNGEFKKDCGIIDTLDQKLCIKEDEKCPLYDVGIGEQGDVPTDDYEYNSLAKIYYNKENYNGQKKIIGKLLLSDGQPCYNINEKLWRKFDSTEVADSHLKCDIEIFGKLNDDRYEKKGDITYEKIYEDNLSTANKELLSEKINGEKVSLYKRIFLGIDKECDEKSDISKDKFNKLKNNQAMEKVCLLVEAILILCYLIPFFIFTIYFYCVKKADYADVFLLVFLAFLFILLLICIICQSVFIGRMMKYDISYNCSDEITNEFFRKENENTKKGILYSAINLGSDIFIVLFNVLSILILCLANNCDCCQQKSGKNETENNNYNDDIKINNAKNSDGISDFKEIDNKNTPNKDDQLKKPTKTISTSNSEMKNLDVPPPASQDHL